MLISEINWGADSAENDPHLLQYFYVSPAFRRLSTRQKQLVTGRKGAGKSALRARLSTHFSAEPDTFVISIAPEYGTIRSILNDKDLRTSFGQEIFFTILGSVKFLSTAWSRWAIQLKESTRLKALPSLEILQKVLTGPQKILWRISLRFFLG